MRKLSGVVSKISNIIPNSADTVPSSNIPDWIDDDALDIDITAATSQVRSLKCYRGILSRPRSEKVDLQLMPVTLSNFNLF